MVSQLKEFIQQQQNQFVQTLSALDSTLKKISVSSGNSSITSPQPERRNNRYGNR